MLDQKGYGYKSLGGVLKEIKGSMFVLKGFLQQRVYVLQSSTVVREFAITDATQIRQRFDIRDQDI